MLDRGMNKMHTNGMKVAISIPDDVFKEVEKLSKEQGTSRSQIFVSAAREYIQRRETVRIIEKLNEVYAHPETPDEDTRRKAMAGYQRRRLAREVR